MFGGPQPNVALVIAGMTPIKNVLERIFATPFTWTTQNTVEFNSSLVTTNELPVLVVLRPFTNHWKAVEDTGCDHEPTEQVICPPTVTAPEIDGTFVQKITSVSIFSIAPILMLLACIVRGRTPFVLPKG